MNFRTDLAVEAHQLNDSCKGITSHRYRRSTLTITRTVISSSYASKRIGKPVGSYITLEGLPLTDNFRDVGQQIQAISAELEPLIPDNGTVLVAGIGNMDITPDALGPKSASSVIATRHIRGELARSAGLDKLRPVAVISPGVLGQTGVETGEMILSLVEAIEPCAVIAIDALASRGLDHLGRTIQISDSGIAPGSGIGNNRLPLNSDTVGIPVIGVGMPTVVDSASLLYDLTGEKPVYLKKAPSNLMVTPREIDLLTERASRLIGMAVNCALQKNYSFEQLAALIS